jgi:hypothetical protein
VFSEFVYTPAKGLFVASIRFFFFFTQQTHSFLCCWLFIPFNPLPFISSLVDFLIAMALKTGFAGLVALTLLFNSCIVSAVNTEAAHYRMKPHHHSTTAPVASTASAAPTGSTQSNGTIIGTNTTAVSPVALNATVLDCFLTLPDNPLSAQGLATPFQLMAPCSQTVSTQQAFAEAGVFDPATGQISIYHPLVIDAGKTPQIAPVVPDLPAGAIVGLWFGFNGATLQLLDTNGEDTNASPKLKAIDCVNGLPGAQGDVFGQVSWCNTVPFFDAADASIAAGKTVIPPLGTDKNGQACPSSRSFKIVDACPSDNLPTQYLLLGDGTTAQDTAANRAAQPGATVIDNASDEALIGLFVDPVIGCTVFQAPSLDDPGAKVGSLVTQELQARQFQQAPIGNVPLNDPDCLLTSDGDVSVAKTNAYRLGVNQPTVAQDPGTLDSFCDNMVSVAPPFFLQNQAAFAAATSPDTGVGSNLFTFLCNRYLMSLMMLTCPPNPNQPVTCQLDGNGAATSCTINLSLNSTTGSANATGTTGAGAGTGATTTAGAVGGMGGRTTSTLATVATGKSAVISVSSLSLNQSEGVGSGTTALSIPGGQASGVVGGQGPGVASTPLGAISTGAALGTGVTAPTCTCTCMAAATNGAVVKRMHPEIEAPAPAPAPHFGRRSIRRTAEHFAFE